MVELNANIYIQPTDPDTLKILEKIKHDYEVSQQSLHDLNKIDEAKTAVLQGIERRNTDPSRAFVNTKIVKNDPTDRKVTGLRRKISNATQEASTGSLNKRAKVGS